MTALTRVLYQITGGHFFAIGDAARDKRVYAYTVACPSSTASLFTGESAVEMREFAPYAMELDFADSGATAMINSLWGESCMVYIKANCGLSDLVRHLRHLTIVELPDGRKVYFRFYDPRVLRGFLPSLTADERSAFWGPVDSFLVESVCRSKLLQFRPREPAPVEVSVDGT